MTLCHTILYVFTDMLVDTWHYATLYCMYSLICLWIHDIMPHYIVCIHWYACGYMTLCHTILYVFTDMLVDTWHYATLYCMYSLMFPLAFDWSCHPMPHRVISLLWKQSAGRYKFSWIAGNIVLCRSLFSYFFVLTCWSTSVRHVPITKPLHIGGADFLDQLKCTTFILTGTTSCCVLDLARKR